MATKLFQSTSNLNQTYQRQKQNCSTKNQLNNKNLRKYQSLRTVRQVVKQLDDYSSYRKKIISQKKKQPEIDREEIRKLLKQKWKDPGYCNMQFTKFKAMNGGKFLNQWEIERICLAQRSYVNPKDFPSYKSCIQSRQFPKLSKDMYPQKFKQYLKQIEQKNQDLLFSPKRKMLTQIQPSGMQKSILRGKKKIFQPYASQNRAFGLGTVTWKSGSMGTNYKTVDSYQYSNF